MNKGIYIAAAVVAAVMVVGAIFLIDIDQTQEASLPDVELTVDGGQLPEFEANVGSIDLTTQEVTVEVPDIEITTEEQTLTLQDINFTSPDEVDAETETETEAEADSN